MKSFYQMPDELEQWIIGKIRTINEDRILRCLIRHTLGFNRSNCQLPHSYIAKWTNIHLKTIPAVTKKLVASGSIVLLKRGSILDHSASIWKVPIVEEYIHGPSSNSSVSTNELLVEDTSEDGLVGKEATNKLLHKIYINTNTEEVRTSANADDAHEEVHQFEEEGSGKSGIEEREKQPNTTRLVLKYYSEQLELIHKVKAYPAAKENTLIKSLVSQVGVDLAKKTVDQYLADPDPFVKNSAYSVGLMCSQRQKYISRAESNSESRSDLSFSSSTSGNQFRHGEF